MISRLKIRRPAALLAALVLAVTGGVAVVAATQPGAPEASASEPYVTVCYVRTGQQGTEKTVQVSRRTAKELLTKTASYPGPCALYGAPSALGNGAVRTYAQLDGARPLSIGVSLPATTLTNLPTPPTDGQRCFDVDNNGSIDAHLECFGGHERPIELPAGLAHRTSTSLKWALVNWNTHGHGPPGIYDTPHLDFHFYIQPRAERDAIRIGPCGIGVNCDDFATGRIPVPAQYLPQDYADLGAVEVKMGNHLVDQSGAEFHGELFTHSFIYGAYAGKVSFLEPMVSLATFQLLKAGPDREICKPIKQPAQWLERGWYPRTYCLRYRENRQDFTVSLENFRRS